MHVVATAGRVGTLVRSAESFGSGLRASSDGARLRDTDDIITNPDDYSPVLVPALELMVAEAS